jgi:hypothetical protein
MQAETCARCEHRRTEGDCRGGLLFLCSLGKFDYPKGIIEQANPDTTTEPSVPIPAWCKLGKGKTI